MRGFFFLAMVILLSVASPAMANFVTYAQWRAAPSIWREAYVAGAFDSLISYSPNGSKDTFMDHYSTCLANSQMTNEQLAINLSTFADSKPELQAKPVQAGLIQYLLALCGPPPQPQ
jgi:hypothetical protein